jgi:DNA-binding LytR/AlgR family response regulator
VPARCLIVDDESPAREELRHLLGEHDDVVVVGEATTAEEAELLIGSLQYDVVFLDIRMPGMGGLELARLLAGRPEHPAIVFTTAYADHAVEAFDLEAADYLVKPFDAERLRRALDRALDHVGTTSAPAAGDDLTDPNPDPRSLDEGGASGGREPVGRGRPASGTVARVAVHRGDRIILIEEPRIAFAEAARGYAYLKLVVPPSARADPGEDRLLTSYTLGDLEERFSSDFVRTHRSYLVNLRHVREVVPHVGGTLTLVMGDRDRSPVPVARRQAAELRRRLGV